MGTYVWTRVFVRPVTIIAPPLSYKWEYLNVNLNKEVLMLIKVWTVAIWLGQRKHVAEFSFTIVCVAMCVGVLPHL